MYSCVSAAQLAVQKFAGTRSSEADFLPLLSQADNILAKFSKLTFPNQTVFIDGINVSLLQMKLAWDMKGLILLLVLDQIQTTYLLR